MGEGGGEIEMTSPSPQPLPSFDTESSFNIESQNEMQGGEGYVNLFIAFVLDKNLPQAQKRGAFQKGFFYI